jgi:hypothetical protein
LNGRMSYDRESQNPDHDLPPNDSQIFREEASHVCTKWNLQSNKVNMGIRRKECGRTELADRLVPTVPRHMDIATKKHPVRAVAFQLASRTASS